jgi:NAD(P)-dependent dehydrogenase (short-subunit alcohol dehydrogenase family)
MSWHEACIRERDMPARYAPRSIAHATVVVTGSSSGIGRATALAFAERGANVVVAARREEALEELADECRQRGGLALAVPTDTTNDAAVDALALHAEERFGRFDVWVNNAGVYASGRFEDVPAEVFRRVIETNLLGYAAGARSALRQFRRQGSGVLINVGSIGSRVPMISFSAYTAAKFGLLGLTRVLRQELRGTDIHVCAVLPASIDTPIFQHAANYSGRALSAMSPVSDSDQVARTIVGLAECPRGVRVVGRSAGFLSLLNAVAPAFAERFVTWMIERQQWRSIPTPPTPGNLFEPIPEWTGTSGGWKPSGPLPIARRTPNAAAVR